MYQSPYLCSSIFFCAVFRDGLNDICHVPDFVLAYNGGRFFFGCSSIHLNTSPFLKNAKKVNREMDFNRTTVSGSLTGVSPRPMLMGAPRNAVWAFNAGVSLCLLRCRRPHSRYACFAARCKSLGFSIEKRRHGAPAVRLGAKGTYPICPILRRRPPDGLSLSKCKQAVCCCVRNGKGG